MTESVDERSAEEHLRALLLPGTPESVASAYATLAERAKSTRFGLLEDEIIVLDTETTGLSYKSCSLIEIAAARLKGTEIIERFDMLINPGTLIPPEIVALTGITNADVAGAPSAEEAVAALAEFTGGLLIIAHNASFDRTFVEKVAGGEEVSDFWIDTLALSRIALPRLKSHKLADMARAFGCEAVTHRAIDDVEALCGVWRVMLTALSDLPDGLIARIADMHPDVEWSYRPILSQIALQERGARFSLKDLRRELIAREEAPQRVDAQTLGRFDAPTREEIEGEFGAEGTAARMYERFESRGDQIAMALEVRDALATSTSRAIEAGTGVGKSVAYLLPEALFARRNNITVGVATKTNALTDQLIAHELPALAEALPGGLAFTSLKGYEHYPCLVRLDHAASGELPVDDVPTDGRPQAEIAEDMLNAIAIVYAFAAQSPEGDLDSLGIRWRYVPRRMLATSASECLRNRCPYYPNECFVHGARRRAAQSDIVVTNHSLLLRNVVADGAILPPIRHWVIDEAHGFEAEARRQWAVELSGEELRAGFERLGGTHTGVLRSLIAQTANSEAGTLLGGLLVKTAASAARASVATAELFETVHELNAITPNEGGYDSSTLWINDGVRTTDEWGAVCEAGAAAKFALDETARFSAEAATALGEAAPQLMAELREASRFIAESAAAIDLICSGEDQSYVYSAQLARSRKRIATEKLTAEKLDIGADLGRLWLPEMASVIFTSATIAVGESFEHFEHSVGLDTLDHAERSCAKLASSFDFDGSMAAVVASGMPDPSSREYLAALEELLFDVHVAMGGSVLTLFTNRREMERVNASLAPRLAAQGLELVCQEKGSSARRLRERFIAEKDLSLMALKSFWEGFDAAGDTLRCVVIPRLPFASPRDPLVCERERRDDRAWWHHSLPEAVLAVKQAAGRLIRTADDTGVLVLADARLITKRYGSQFTKSLPTTNVSTIERENIGRFVSLWRASHGG